MNANRYAIRRIGVGSAMKFGLVLGALTALVFGLLSLLLFAVMDNALGQMGLGGLINGPGSALGLLVSVLLGAILGALLAAIYALIYNVTASFMGGIEVELDGALQGQPAAGQPALGVYPPTIPAAPPARAPQPAQAGAQYPAPQYPAQQYPAQQYPAQQYPAQQPPAQPQPYAAQPAAQQAAPQQPYAAPQPYAAQPAPPAPPAPEPSPFARPAPAGPYLALAGPPPQNWAVRQPQTSLGSQPPCDVLLNGAQPHHADLRFENGRWILYDLSGGQTWVNGRQVNGANMLKDGFTVRIGGAEMVFHA